MKEISENSFSLKFHVVLIVAYEREREREKKINNIFVSYIYFSSLLLLLNGIGEDWEEQEKVTENWIKIVKSKRNKKIYLRMKILLSD